MNMEVCRICMDLLHDSNFDPLDGFIKDMISLLAPEMNLELSEKPIICHTCSSPLEELFNYKSNFLLNEDKLVGLFDKIKGPIDLRDMLNGSTTGDTTNQIKAKEKFCRTCLELIDCDSYTMLDSSQSDIYLNCMLEMCLPEIDLKLSKNPLMCEPCLDKLQKLHHLKSSCLETEKKLKTYCEMYGTNSSCQISLEKVLHSDVYKRPNILGNGIFPNLNVPMPEVNAVEFLAVEVKIENPNQVDTNGKEIDQVMMSNGKENNFEKSKKNMEVDVKSLGIEITKGDEVVVKQELTENLEIKEETVENDRMDLLAINLVIFIVLSTFNFTNGKLYFCLPYKPEVEDQTDSREVASLIDSFKTFLEDVIEEESETSPNNFQFNFSHPAITLAGSLFDTTTKAGNHDWKFLHFAPAGFQLFNLTYPNVTVEGSNYTFDGHVGKGDGLFRLYGSNGSFLMNPLNFSIALTMELMSNSSGFCVPVHLGVIMQDMKARFDHVMDGDSLLEPLFNKLIGIIGSEATGIIWDEVADYLAGPIQEKVNKWLHWNSTAQNSDLIRLISWIHTNKDDILSRKIELNLN